MKSVLCLAFLAFLSAAQEETSDLLSDSNEVEFADDLDVYCDIVRKINHEDCPVENCRNACDKGFQTKCVATCNDGAIGSLFAQLCIGVFGDGSRSMEKLGINAIPGTIGSLTALTGLF